MKDQKPDITAPARRGKRRILVVANETIEGAALRELITLRAESDPPPEVLVVAPALNSRLGHWLSDVDEAQRSAGLRLGASLERLNAAGIEAEGMVGDADPVQAIADAVHLFGAQEIVIATHPEERAHWLARDLVGRARRRFSQPVVDVVLEPGAGSGGSSESSTRGRRALSALSAALHARNT